MPFLRDDRKMSRDCRSRASFFCARFLAHGWAYFLVAVTCPQAAHAARSYGLNKGYVSDVHSEREQVVHDLPLIAAPEEPTQTLQNEIFNDTLTKEFRERYQQRFGYTDVEQAYYSPNRFTYYSDLYGFKGTPEENNQARQDFGAYMLRRLAEWHVDNYLKNDPKARPIYEAKEKLSNVKLEVDTFKFDARYSFSDNTVDLNCKNPYADTSVTIAMGGSAGPPETIVSLSRPVTKTSTVETHWKTQDGIISLIGRKALGKALGTSLTLSTYTRPEGVSTRESLYLAGLSYVF